MRITIKDIASEAGVSVSKVSYVLNKSGRVVLESHKRILDIARKYNYVPDANAKGLVTGVSNNVGLVIPQNPETIFKQPFLVKSLSELGKNLSAASGWLSMCLGSDLSVTSMRKYLGNAKLDGIIFMYTDNAEDIAALLTSRHTPCIFFDRTSRCAASISCDDDIGIKMAFDHLRSLGHNKILFISGMNSASEQSNDNRMAAYLESVSLGKLQYRSVLYGKFTKQGGYAAVKEYLENGGCLPDAIIAGNDRMAWGAMELLAEKNIRVPSDVSIVGFDDADEEYNDDVGLTTIRQPIAQMLKYCVDYIYECLETGELTQSQVKMAPELIVRSSTCKVKG